MICARTFFHPSASKQVHPVRRGKPSVSESVLVSARQEDVCDFMLFFVALISFIKDSERLQDMTEYLKSSQKPEPETSDTTKTPLSAFR